MERQYMANVHDKSPVRQTLIPVNNRTAKPDLGRMFLFLRNWRTPKKSHRETASVCTSVLKMIQPSRGSANIVTLTVNNKRLT